MPLDTLPASGKRRSIEKRWPGSRSSARGWPSAWRELASSARTYRGEVVSGMRSVQSLASILANCTYAVSTRILLVRLQPGNPEGEDVG